MDQLNTFCTFGFVPAEEDHISSGLGEGEANCSADIAISAGYDTGMVNEIKVCHNFLRNWPPLSASDDASLVFKIKVHLGLRNSNFQPSP